METQISNKTIYYGTTTNQCLIDWQLQNKLKQFLNKKFMNKN